MKIITNKMSSRQRIVTKNGSTKYGIYSRKKYLNTTNIAYLGFMLVYS